MPGLLLGYLYILINVDSYIGAQGVSVHSHANLLIINISARAFTLIFILIYVANYTAAHSIYCCSH